MTPFARPLLSSPLRNFTLNAFASLIQSPMLVKHNGIEPTNQRVGSILLSPSVKSLTSLRGFTWTGKFLGNRHFVAMLEAKNSKKKGGERQMNDTFHLTQEETLPLQKERRVHDGHGLPASLSEERISSTRGTVFFLSRRTDNIYLFFL